MDIIKLVLLCVLSIILFYYTIDVSLVVAFRSISRYWSKKRRGKIYSPKFQGYMYTSTLKYNPELIEKLKNSTGLTKYEVEVSDEDISKLRLDFELLYALFRSAWYYIVVYLVLLCVFGL